MTLFILGCVSAFIGLVFFAVALGHAAKANGLPINSLAKPELHRRSATACLVAVAFCVVGVVLIQTARL